MSSLRTSLLLALASLAPACGGDSTSPASVASVVITTPANAVTIRTVGRTIPFTGQARNAEGTVLPDTVFWVSSNPAVASVTTTHGTTIGVTALANGTTTIAAAAGGHLSAGVTVTVNQLATGIHGLGGLVLFGAIGSTRQLIAVVVDSSDAPVTGALPPTFSRAGSGATATVSMSGLVTATGPGFGDTVVATSGALSARVPIAVNQVPLSIAVTSDFGSPDILYTTGRTRQFTASARDTNDHPIAMSGFSWSSSLSFVASVDQSGLVTAEYVDGNVLIQAALGGIGGGRTMLVHHYPATFILSPGNTAINTVGGSSVYSGTAQDSVGIDMAILWQSRRPLYLSVVPAPFGRTATVTAVRNGPTWLVISAGLGTSRRDSVLVTVTNQPQPPLTVAVTLADYSFSSVRNGTQNPAVDTVGVSGTVTWTWTGAASHGVVANQASSIIGSATKSSGAYAVTFNFPGTYDYTCTIHGSLMTGTIVVQ